MSVKKLIYISFIALTIATPTIAFAEKQDDQILKKDEYLILHSALCNNSSKLSEDEVADTAASQARGFISLERAEELEEIAVDMLSLSSKKKADFCQK